ncbi:MAG: SUMF1/EgtB/PvdO family nonheme iron enzyme [Planctomycetota bacterium]
MPEQEEQQTSIIGDFEVYKEQLLGKGAWGEVYRGRQISLERPVAVKILKKDLSLDEEFVRRFMREAKCIAQLVDENIIQVYGAGKYEEAYYFAMEFVQGTPLQKFLDRDRKFLPDEIIYIGMCVAKALKAAWESPAQIVHRDIKPSNIMISFTSSLISAHRKEGVSESLAFLDVDIKESRVKVMDFGLAKAATSSGKDATMVGTIIGTPKYISPEQGLGNPADIRSDIYSLGIVLYELSTGRIPFTSDSAVSLVRHHIYDTAMPPRDFNPDLPADLESVIMKCIQKDPNHRYGNPSELLADLEALRRSTTPLYATQTMANMGATIIARPKETKSNKISLFIISTTVAVICIAAIIWLVFVYLPKKDNNTPAPPLAQPNAAVSSTAITENPPPIEPPPPTEDPVKKLENLCVFIEQCISSGSATNLEQADRKLVEAKSIDANNEQVKLLEILLKQKNNELLTESDRKKRDDDYNKFLMMGKEANTKRDWKSALQSFYDAQAKNNTPAVEDEIQKVTSIIKLQEQYDSILDKAHKSEDTGNYEEAIRMYEQLTKLFSQVKDFYIKEPTPPRESIKECQKRLDEKKYQRLLNEGEQLLKDKKYNSAEEKFKQAQGIKPNEQVISDKLNEIKKQLQPNMVFIEESNFIMGEKGKTAKEVSVSSFFIDIYEVTNEEYKKFYDYIKSTKDHKTYCHKNEKQNEKRDKNHLPEFWNNDTFKQAEANFPVVGVDWYDAYAYASWAGKRLPTSKEWEKAARGLDGRRIYPGGWKERTEIKANIKGVGPGSLTAVGSWPQDISPYRCYDMTGNVSEWTSDCSDKGKIVVRGGDYKTSPSPVYKIDDGLINDRFNYLGFRCVKPIK